MLSEVKSTSSHLRLLQPTGPRLCPLSPLLIHHWSSPSTDPTTLPWCQIQSSPPCPAITSPCSCGCEGAAPTSNPRPLRPEEIAKRRRPSYAALSRMVCFNDTSWGSFVESMMGPFFITNAKRNVAFSSYPLEGHPLKSPELQWESRLENII